MYSNKCSEIGNIYYITAAENFLDFQGPPLPMALEMDLPASKSLCLAPYKQQEH
jgi:hypothetical protein